MTMDTAFDMVGKEGRLRMMKACLLCRGMALWGRLE